MDSFLEKKCLCQATCISQFSFKELPVTDCTGDKAMSSASPQYTFSSVFAEPKTSVVLTHNGSSDETNNSSINETSSNSDHNSNNIICMGVLNTSIPCNISSGSNSIVSSSISCNISSDSSNGSSNSTYDPFKCLSAMAEQSLTGNFTHSSSTSNITDGSICNSRGNITTITSSCDIMTVNNFNTSSSLMNLEQPIHYPACDRNMYLALSLSSSLSSTSPPLSPSSSHCMYMSTPNLDTSNDFLNRDNSSYHKISTSTNENISPDCIRNDSPLSQSPPVNQNLEKGVIDSTRSICKKSYPSCSSEQALDESDRLLSWTLQHPEGWSNREVLDWVFFVAQEHGLDMQEFRGENFQGYTGTQLCRMGLEDFTRLEPKFGKFIYRMFRDLLRGVVFQKPIDPDHLSSSSVQMSPYSPVLSPKMSMDMQCCPQPLYQASGVEMNDSVLPHRLTHYTILSNLGTLMDTFTEILVSQLHPFLLSFLEDGQADQGLKVFLYLPMVKLFCTEALPS